jgi:hypothetical protein
VGCNLGSAGDGFLCDVADGLVAFTKIGFHGCGLPAETIGDVIDGKAGGAESDGCGDSIGMRDKPFDVDAQVMRGVGISADAGGLHDFLDILAGEETKSTRVVAAKHAEGVTGGNA